MSARSLLQMLCFGLGLCLAAPASADATVTACGKDVWPNDPRTDLREALAAGGRITFACSGSILFSQGHLLLKDVEIGGGGAVTLDGNGHRMFGMGSARFPNVTFKAIRIVGGAVGPSGLPGSVISGEGNVAFLDGTNISLSQKPVWVLAGNVVVRNAWLHENAGPVVVVSEGSLDIAKTTRFTDNPGQTIATGPATRVSISDTQFFRNGGASFGGTAAQGCEVSIAGSWFADNRVAEDGGALSSHCKLTLEDTQFERNHAGRDGGAVFLGPGAEVTAMRKVRFTGNQAARNGGAIAGIWTLARRGALSVRSGRFEGNLAGATGGAIHAGESSRIDVGLGSFIGNQATNAGGAVYVRQSPLRVGRSVFLKNRTASTGGAIASLCMPASAGRVANSLFAGNVAGAGGVFHGTHMTFINATLVTNGNTPVQQGSNCSDRSEIAFANTILDGGCGGGDAARTFKDLGHNLQFPGQSCGPTIPSAFPLLGFFFAPFPPFSPAIGAGDLKVCMAAPIDGRDLHGTHRPQGSACSIGAIEGDFSAAFTRLIARRRGDLPAR